jgi:hypothetical protein
VFPVLVKAHTLGSYSEIVADIPNIEYGPQHLRVVNKVKSLGKAVKSQRSAKRKQLVALRSLSPKEQSSEEESSFP